MSKNYEDASKKIVAAVGGVENINHVYHCATRLRVVVKDKSIVKKDDLEQIDGISGSVIQGNEVQNIIGTDVHSFYNAFTKEIGFSENTDSNNSNDPQPPAEKQKLTVKTALSKVLDFISGVVLPVMPVFLAAGLIMALLNILTNVFGLSNDSGTYKILSSISSSGFYFLPIFVGFQAAIKLKIPASMGAFVGAILIFSGINDVKGLDFLHIPVPQTAYNGTILPSILGVLLLAVIYRGVDKILLKEIRYFLTPIISIIITIPIVLLVFGPLGNVVSFALADFFNFLSSKMNWLAFALYSALNPILVMFGIDKGFVPISLNNIATMGYDTLVLPAALTSNAAMGAAATAVAFWSKNKKTKSTGFSAGITGILGITEPSIFGLLLPYRRALVGAIAGGAVGGLFGGIFHIVQGAQISPGLVALSTYFVGKAPSANLISGAIALVISIVASFVITSILIRLDKKKEENKLFANEK